MKDCQVYSGIVVGDTRVTKMYCDPCATEKGHKVDIHSSGCSKDTEIITKKPL